MKRLMLALAMTMSAALLVGCQSAQRGPGAAGADPVPLSQYPRIAVIEDMHKHIVASQPIISADVDRPMRVSVPIRWTKDSDKAIDYRFEFFDVNGRMLQPDPGWRYTQLPPRAQVQLDGSATDTTAADWRLIIRPARSQN